MSAHRSTRARALLVAGLLGLAAALPGCSKSERPAYAGPLPRVLLIGIDGADLRDVRRLADAGRLPNIAALMERGLALELETVSTSSPIIWTSIATGVVPERHGIQFFAKDGVVARSTMRERPAFWNVLTHYGHTVGVLAWWATFPAELVNGFIVSPYVVFVSPGGKKPVGVVWDQKDGYKTFPPGLYRLLREKMRWAESVDLEEMGTIFAGEDKTRSTRWVWARDSSYHAMTLDLMKSHPVELLAVYYQGVDIAGHDFTEYVFGKNVNEVREPKVDETEHQLARQRVDDMYTHIDGYVGELLENIPPETDVILVSDHGWEYDGTSHWNFNPGTFIAAGPSFRPDADPETISVLDVTPILFTILGVPLAEDFDGKVPANLLREDLMGARELVATYDMPPVAVDVEGLGDTLEEGSMLEELVKLGYVDEEELEKLDQRTGGE